MAFSTEDFYENAQKTPEKFIKSNSSSVLKHKSNNWKSNGNWSSPDILRIKKDDQHFKHRPKFGSEQKAKYPITRFEPPNSPSNQQLHKWKRIDSYYSRIIDSPKSESFTSKNNNSGNNNDNYNRAGIRLSPPRLSEDLENVENVPPKVTNGFQKHDSFTTGDVGVNKKNALQLPAPDDYNVKMDLPIIDLEYSTDSSNFLNKYSKSDIPGLKNLGNTCYMNCSLHAIFSFKEFWIKFWQKFEEIRKSEKFMENPHAEIVSSLFKLYQDYKNSSPEIETSLAVFKEQFGKVHSGFNSTNPQDAPEFITCLIDSLDSIDGIADTDKWPNLIKTFFFTEITFNQRCETCDYEMKTMEYNSSILALAFPELNETNDKRNISETFQKHFTDPRIEKCLKCEQQTEPKSSTLNISYHLTKCSNALMIHLNRHNVETKISEPIFPSNTLTIAVDQDNIIRKENDGRVCQRIDYHLKSIICHKGQYFTNGHYISYVHHDQDKWYRCNDEYIREVTYNDVINDCPPSSYIFLYELDKPV